MMQTDAHDKKDVSKPRTLADYARLFFTGFAMGAADIVPGVSGGTMAFILGVYQALLNAIKSFNLDAARLALKGKLGVLLGEHIPLRFLITLGLGILVAIFSLASLLSNWLDTSPTFVFAFFGGLIIASIVAIGVQVRWSMISILTFIAGTVIAFIIVGLPSVGEQLGHSAPVLFFSGMIAICAMILPGISGSFILLILGQYDFILNAVRNRDILSLIAVALGAVIGILAFSRILSWLLKHYEHPTVAALVGFMLGSLRLIYDRMVQGAGADFGATNIAIAFALAVAGFVIVSLLDHMQSRRNPFFRLFSRA